MSPKVRALNTNRIRLVSADELYVERPEDSLLAPFTSAVSPLADELDRDSVFWARRFSLCDSERQYEKLTRSRVGRLAARGFPHGNRAGLQLAADWTTLFCLLDDKIESSGVSIARVADYVGQLSDAFRDGKRGSETATLALVDLRDRFLVLGGPVVLNAFADSIDRIFSAFMWEHLNRKNQLHPSLTAYAKMRTLSVGLYPQFVLARITDGVELSDELLAHPTVQKLMELTAAIVGVTNDLFTFAREAAEGEVHNRVVLLMHECAMSPHEARFAAVEQHNAYVRQFHAAERPLPSAGHEELQLLRFVGVLRSWIRGHLDWAHETGRYQLPE